ncbi:2-Nitropropane dioxygenase [Seminavis robusta]|uniref:2-Nitropropane dioxygenase n=1 Tax=Seminavis robusta TaxID=568900 RepID=A0A9N8DEF0_9STRA|nr:2-Nitropropane dioxygenase [Seminavis robusta]|eukprot:Sro55_g032420.1 2-Nitropropane dioxygenase (548) ;mRNA; f:110171-111814
MVAFLNMFALHLVWLALFASPVASLSTMTPPPRIIQGGMGIRISSWELAREVSKTGELGVISGSGMDTIFIRGLQLGDPDGAFRRALATFPDQDMVQRAMDKYFVEGGKDEHAAFKHLPMWSLKPQQSLLEATVLANYCEVWLAKHNDDSKPTGGLVGMNLLTKVELPTIPSLYGAMLADVDYIIMGAGIPMAIPGILDNLAEAQDCVQSIHIEGTLLENTPEPTLTFSPQDFWEQAGKPELNKELKRPDFLPIVSSVVLAQSMLKRASGKGPTKGIDGFVVELNTAGGHNAPPRGAMDLNEKGEPVYGPKDDVDLTKFQKAVKGLPFWMAGSYAKPEKFAQVKEIGGAGVQVGTAFALSQESGMKDETRQRILNELMDHDLEVFTDPVASPTGFPFKVLGLEGTLADPATYEARDRVCNLGYLRNAYVRPDGKIGFRCASEPVDQFVKKGGSQEQTEGRKCLCNALCADAGYPQVYGKTEESFFLEPSLITIGDDVNNCRKFIQKDEESGRLGYSSRDVVDYLLSEWKACEELEGATNATETLLRP